MRRRPPGSTRTDALFPYTTLFRSRLRGLELAVVTLAAAIAATSWALNPRFFDWVPTARVQREPLLGRFDISSATAIHHLSLALLVNGLPVLRGIRQSRTGRALLALRDNTRGAQDRKSVGSGREWGAHEG